MKEDFGTLHELAASVTVEQLQNFILRNKFQRLREKDEFHARRLHEGWTRENGIDITPNAIMRFKDEEGNVHRIYTCFDKFGQSAE